MEALVGVHQIGSTSWRRQRIIPGCSTPLRPRTHRPQLKRDPFYESDCQGETSSPLIAWRSSPEQSAPSAEGTRPAGASGSAWQSSSASCSSRSVRIRPGRMPALRSRARARRTMVLSETRPVGRPDASSGSARGPRVRRVPRQTAPGERIARDCPPHPRPGSWNRRQGVRPSPSPRRSERASALASSASSDQSVLLSSRAAA